MMAELSSIEWTDATWNPVTGCSVVSPGCTNCYAMRLAGTRLRHHASRAGLTRDSKAGPVWTGEVRLNESWVTQPLQWRRPRKIFVCAHGDLFHESVPDAWIDRVFAVMALAPQHTFQVLTKRSARMRDYFTTCPSAMRRCAIIGQMHESMREARTTGFTAIPWPLPNVWLGVSVEDQRRADERVPDLLATPAAVRWVSAEPLLGPIGFAALNVHPNRYLDAFRCDYHDGSGNVIAGPPSGTGPLDWVIVGGESGPGARPMHPQWARGVRDQCAAAGVPFHFKQWGEFLPLGQSLPGTGRIHGASAVKPGRMKLHHAGTPEQYPKYAFAEKGVEFASTSDCRVTFLVGKARAGRLLDGIEHNGMPGDAR